MLTITLQLLDRQTLLAMQAKQVEYLERHVLHLGRESVGKDLVLLAELQQMLAEAQAVVKQLDNIDND